MPAYSKPDKTDKALQVSILCKTVKLKAKMMFFEAIFKHLTSGKATGGFGGGGV
jgi:hypothetical protein